jgi:hypothetical protein
VIHFDFSAVMIMARSAKWNCWSSISSYQDEIMLSPNMKDHLLYPLQNFISAQKLYRVWIKSIYSRTYLITPLSRVLLKKLTGPHVVKKFPAFYGNRKFITSFTTARHLSLSWAGSIQSITSSHPTSWGITLILSSHLRQGLPSGLFPSGVLIKIL